VLADKEAVYTFDAKWHLVAWGPTDGEIRWMSRLRSPGVWGPVRFGRYLAALSQEGHIAVLDPEREIKIWEGQVGGRYHQPPAIALDTRIGAVMATASNDAGLKLFRINEFYCR